MLFFVPRFEWRYVLRVLYVSCYCPSLVIGLCHTIEDLGLSEGSLDCAAPKCTSNAPKICH
jgi:hypothetical protein